MASYLPEQTPSTKRDTETPRVAARVQDDRGFLFLNNYERTYHLPDKEDFQARLKLLSGIVDVPRLPVDIPSGTYPIWPINLDVAGMRLPLFNRAIAVQLNDPHTLVFFAWPGIAPEFAFETKMVFRSRVCEAIGSRARGHIH